MEKRLLAMLCILTLSLGLLCGCGSSETLTEEGFQLRSTEMESKSGSYQIIVEFFESSPTVEYILYENNKEVTNDVKDKAGKAEFQFDMLDKKPGKYIYKLTVKDEDGSIYEKEIEVKVIKANQKNDKDEKEDEESVEETTQEDVIEEKPSYNDNVSSNDSNTGSNSNSNSGNSNSESTGNNSSSNNSGSTGGEIDNGESSYVVWTSYQKYYKGDIVIYEGREYRCRQEHTSLENWTPTNVASLWEEV